MRQVPDVVGKTLSIAAETLNSAGFPLGKVREQFNLSVPAGIVMAQSPRANVVTLQGTAVDLAVSLGPILTPDVSGMSHEAARQAIVAAQLSVGGETGEYNPAIPVDVVIRQIPPGGTPVLPDAAIDIFFSLGPAPVPAPDVTRQPQASAVEVLIAAGLTAGVLTQEYSATVPAGAVISQVPIAGTSVLPGTAVDLAISLGVQPVAVPDVVGLTQSQAETAIIGASLLVGDVSQAHDVNVPEGHVISQTPAPDTEVPPGSTVAFVVSLGPAPEGEGEGEGEGQPPIDVDTTRQQLAETFTEADANSDGQLSFDEAVAVLPGLTHDVFDALDTNGDGQLSPEELDMDTGCGCMGSFQAKSRSFGDGLTILFGVLGMVALAHLKRW